MVHIRTLRKKIEAPNSPKMIKTVRKGYMFKEDGND